MENDSYLEMFIKCYQIVLICLAESANWENWEEFYSALLQNLAAAAAPLQGIVLENSSTNLNNSWEVGWQKSQNFKHKHCKHEVTWKFQAKEELKSHFKLLILAEENLKEIRKVNCKLEHSPELQDKDWW